MPSHKKHCINSYHEKTQKLPHMLSTQTRTVLSLSLNALPAIPQCIRAEHRTYRACCIHACLQPSDLHDHTILKSVTWVIQGTLNSLAHCYTLLDLGNRFPRIETLQQAVCFALSILDARFDTHNRIH